LEYIIRGAVMISTKTCKRKLAALWFTGALILFVLLIIQSIFGKYGTDFEEVWAWFLPTVMPTLSLIIGVLVFDATATGGTDKQIERFMFWLAFAVSAIYLVLVAVTILVQPFTDFKPTELIKRSNLWLGPIQGLVAAVLGAFFVKSERGEN
jgi:Na+/H+-dicarboxylate symporter